MSGVGLRLVTSLPAPSSLVRRSPVAIEVNRNVRIAFKAENKRMKKVARESSAEEKAPMLGASFHCGP